MLKNSKLSYIVPNYTGHIPKAHEKFYQLDYDPPHGQIPGYAGYIKSVKPENIFAKTYGNITYDINVNGVRQGRDVHPDERYSSLSRSTFVDQSQIRQRTAAEIVGVKPQSAQNGRSFSMGPGTQSMTQSNLPTNHHLKHLPSLAGLNSQRQVAHINDGTWTSKMMINTPNPYLAHWNQSQVPVPKHLQVEGGYIPNSATSSVKNIQGQTGQNLSTQGGNQANNGAFVQSQNLGPNATQQNFASTGASLGSLDEKTYKNMTGSILNQTRGLNLSNKDFPVILDGEVIIADGTVKPNYIPYKGPTVGYTGHGRRIAADNIYGATFANARSKAEVSKQRLICDRENNVTAVAESIPPLKTNTPGQAVAH